MTTHYLLQNETMLDQKQEENQLFSSLRLFHENRHARNATYSPISSCPQPLTSPSHYSEPFFQPAEDVQSIDPSPARHLRFEVILEAATAVTQKAEETTMTYLNRGQTYGIELTDKHAQNEIITSTVSIAFHSSSHRRIAENYWKFWINQQKQTDPRAIEIDSTQSQGISDLSFPSFDRITFSWNGRFGAKIFVRFNCLSTDFSRIKGVKGIPLRAQMESRTQDLLMEEVCFCKVKLFRDKGAERKNKDDAKQISKQLEKVYGKATEQSLPLMYNVSLPCSVFNQVPNSSSSSSVAQKKMQRCHTRIMTAPTLFHRTLDPVYPTKEDSISLQTDSIMTSLPTVDTNNLSPTDPFHFSIDTQSPPFTYTPTSTTHLDYLTMKQPEPFLYATHFPTPLELPTSQIATKSIYDLFTPEEIRSSEEDGDDVCPTPNSQDISTLQQRLQQHNQVASSILLNSHAVSDLLLLSHPSSLKSKRRRSSKANHSILSHSHKKRRKST